LTSEVKTQNAVKRTNASVVMQPHLLRGKKRLVQRRLIRKKRTGLCLWWKKNETNKHENTPESQSSVKHG